MPLHCRAHLPVLPSWQRGRARRRRIPRRRVGSWPGCPWSFSPFLSSRSFNVLAPERLKRLVYIGALLFYAVEEIAEALSPLQEIDHPVHFPLQGIPRDNVQA